MEGYFNQTTQHVETESIQILCTWRLCNHSCKIHR